MNNIKKVLFFLAIQSCFNKNLKLKDKVIDINLILLIEAGNFKEVIKMLNEDTYVEVKDKYGRTALYYAVQRGYKEIAKLLIEKGAVIEINDKGDEWIALHAAAKYGHKEIVELLINKGANMEAQNSKKETALHIAALWEQEDIIKLLIEKGANINALNKYKETAVHYAAAKENKELIELLINKGININIPSKVYGTALHIVAVSNNLEIAKLLINKGANIEVKNEHGETALHTAAANGSKEIVELLINKGADIEAEDEEGRAALFKGINYGDNRNNKEVAELLINKGANILKIFHLVNFIKNEEIIKIILKNYYNKYGAYIEGKDYNLYHLAIWFKYRDKLKKAVENNSLIELKNLLKVNTNFTKEDKNSGLKNRKIEYKDNEINESIKLIRCINEIIIAGNLLGIAIDNNNIEIIEFLINLGANKVDKDNILYYNNNIINLLLNKNIISKEDIKKDIKIDEINSEKISYDIKCKEEYKLKVYNLFIMLKLIDEQDKINKIVIDIVNMCRFGELNISFH